jgi:transaldolase
MKFFIDTANIEEIKEAQNIGIIDGVTTNPTLVAKTGKEHFQCLEEICAIVKGPVSAETVSLEAKKILAEARELSKIAKNIVVKIPMMTEGLKAVKMCADEGINTNVTLIFSPVQALLAAKTGASYVSPFVGRLDDISEVGMELVGNMVQIFENYDFQTEIIVASVRNPIHVMEAALMGADIATIPFDVIEKLTKHPLTDIGIKKFLDDYNKIPKTRKV